MQIALIIRAENGELRCNETSLVSKGSCVGPYVDNLFGVAIGLGFHIAGASSYEDKAKKSLDDVINNFFPGVGIIEAFENFALNNWKNLLIKTWINKTFLKIFQKIDHYLISYLS